MLVDIVGDDSLPRNTLTVPPKARPGRPKTKVLTQASSSTSASGSRTPVGEDWVLDCDICHRTGVNKVSDFLRSHWGTECLLSLKLPQDDGSPLLCCGKCSKWQHIACHDLADRQAGRPKRDWDREEFVCRACQDRSVVNGRQGLNGSGSYDASRTPNPYPHSAYTSPVPYSSAYPPHTPRSPYQRHTAFTFTHYQPQQHGFSSAHALHAQSTIPAAAATSSTYNQPHYSPSKSAQYAAALQASAVVWMSGYDLTLTDLSSSSTLLTRIPMAPTGPRQHLPHRRARAAPHICRPATRRHLIVRARSALRCRVRIHQRYRTGTRPCSRSRGGEVPTWLPSVAFLHIILRARSPNHINIEHLDTFTTDDSV